MIIPLSWYLVVGAALFCIGFFGALTRRNAVAILMAFSRYVTPHLLTGQFFAIFVVGIAAAEAALGLAIIIAIYRVRETANADEINLMKW